MIKTVRKKRTAKPKSKSKKSVWSLRLYIAGQTPNCITALKNLTRICQEYLSEKHQIEVIDLLINPALAQADQVLAIPTLIRKLPEPMRRIIGDLSNAEHVLGGLDLRPGPIARHA